MELSYMERLLLMIPLAAPVTEVTIPLYAQFEGLLACVTTSLPRVGLVVPMPTFPPVSETAGPATMVRWWAAVTSGQGVLEIPGRQRPPEAFMCPPST